MALTATGSALVAGSSAENPMAIQNTQRVKVLRAFFFERKLCKVESEIDLPWTFAHEVRAAGKAEFVEAAAAKAPEAKQPAPDGQGKSHSGSGK